MALETEKNRLTDLAGKVVLITGASSGLGREFAVSFAKQGCNVVVTARRLDLLHSLCNEIEQLNSSSKAVMVQMDVSSSETLIDLAVEKAWHSFGSIDILVNNAGYRGDLGRLAFSLILTDTFSSRGTLLIPRVTTLRKIITLQAQRKSIKDNTNHSRRAADKAAEIQKIRSRGSVKSPLQYQEEEWNTVMNTNLRGAWLVSKAIGTRMRDAGKKGSIINISSTASVNRGNLPRSMIYAISKVGLNQLTKAMALELGRYNIRVNSIAAGLFKSEITKGVFENDWFYKVAERIVPLQRWGSTDPDLTSLLLLLASDSSSYVTGNIFIVDGGHTIPGFPLWSSL